MPPLQGAVREVTHEEPPPPKRPRLAALGDVAISAFFVVFLTSRLHDGGFSWPDVIMLIVASGVLGAKIAIHAPLFRTTKAAGRGAGQSS